MANTNWQKRTVNWTDRVDKVVADFTSGISRLANEADVDFEYAGSGPNKPAEIQRVMQINAEIVNNLLKGENG